MKTRFVAYDRLGAKRGVLSQILQADIVPSKNELSTLTLTYPRNVPTDAFLKNTPEIAFEYYQNHKWVEPRDARFVLQGNEFDYLDDVPTRSYTFIGVGEALSGVFVYGPNGLPRNEEGKVQFGKSNPGAMISHVWDYAVTRGWKGFSKSFNATTDSAGRPWSTTLSMSFQEDTSLESMIGYFERSGLIDFSWTGRTLNVYNADTALQRDLTTGNDPMRFNLSGGKASIDSAPESHQVEGVASHVIVIGENGNRWTFPTGAVLPEGRREVFLSYSGVDDEGTARILAAPTIAKYSHMLQNTTRQFRITESTQVFPLIDYIVGDWVLIEKENGSWERVQIFQVALLINNDGVQGYVSLGDKIDSLIERLNEAVQRVQGGSLTEGTEKPEVAPLAPSAPADVVMTTVTLSDNQGRPQGVVGINFTHDGRDINGDFISMDRYEVQYRRKGTQGWSLLLILQAPTQSGTYSWLRTQEEDGALITYEFRVIAYSTKQIQSKPSPTASLQMKRDTEAPGVPAAPTVKAAYGVFTVTTLHRTTSNTTQPNDYSHVIVQMSASPSGPWVDTDTIVPPMNSAYITGEGYVTRHFRLIAVDREGNRSDASASASGLLKPLVDVDVILKEIDASKTIIKNAEKLILASGIELGKQLSDNDKKIADTTLALTGPGGLTERLTGAEKLLNDVGSIAIETGKTLRQKLSETDAELTAAGKRLTTTETNLASATAQITAAEELIASNNVALNTKLTTATNSIAAAQGQVDTLRNTTVPKLNSDLAAATSRLTTAEGKLTTAQADLTTAKTDLTAAKKQITDNKVITDAAAVRLTTAESEITGAKTRLVTAEGQITTLKDTTVPKLNSDLAAAVRRVADAELDLTAAEADIDAAQANITKVTNQVTPLVTAMNVLQTTTIPGLTTSINGKNGTVNSTADASTPGNYKLGDTWQKWTTLGVGGKLLQSWRHNGTAWVAELMDPTYLPLVDIGAGTFGTLSGGRLTVGSVSADKVLIGVGDNLLLDPYFEDDALNTLRTTGREWHIVTNTSDGKYLTSNSLTQADIPIGNSESFESFPVDKDGVYSLTYDVGGPDVMQAYLGVTFADGYSASGPFIRDLTFPGSRGRGTVFWDMSQHRSPNNPTAGPVKARLAIRRKTLAAGATNYYSAIYFLRFGAASNGELIVSGSITGDHVQAESIAAKIGTFVKADIGNLVVTGASKLNTLVAQQIASDTATFQTVDAKNLFVTGTSSLNEVVAKRLAAETGIFLSLTTDQLTAGSGNINNLVAQKIAAGTAAFQKADISNLTAGSANMTQAVIDKLVANTAKFQTVTVDNITATATANLNTVVAQRIAAGTASFQTVDVKNLFVTGTSSMTDVVAKRIAAEAGTFITLNVDQLDVTGNANFKTAVADKLFVNMFATNKLTTNELLVGKGENLIPWLVNNDASSRTVLPHATTNGAGSLNIDGNGTGLAGNHAIMQNTTVVPGTYLTTIEFRPGAKTINQNSNVFPVLPSTKYKLSVWIRAGGSYASGLPNVRFNVGLYDATAKYVNGPWFSTPKLLSWNWEQLTYEFETNANHAGILISLQMDQPGNLRIDQPSFTKDGASLIATGGIVADHITASEAMSAKMGQFLKLDAGSLTVTGSTKLNEAVVKTLFTEIFATNKLTANQVIIAQPGNMFPDPNFMDTTGWNTVYPLVAGGRNGNRALELPLRAGQTGTYYGDTDKARQIPVISGSTYSLSAWVKGDVAIPVGGVAIYMKWLDGQGGTNYTTPSYVSNTEVIPANTWRQISGRVAVSDTATTAYIGLYRQNSINTRVLFSEPGVVQAIDQGLIVDNGITARHITASEEMSAKLGKFLKVELVDLVSTGTANLNTAVIENLWNNVVRSRKMTTDMLLVGAGTNLIANGFGEMEDNSNFPGMTSNHTNAVKHGARTSWWVLGTKNVTTQEKFSLEAGKEYHFSFLLAAQKPGTRFYVQLRTSEAEAENPYLISNQQEKLGNSTFDVYEADFVAPAGATSAQLTFYLNHTNSTDTTGYVWIAGVAVREKYGSSLIVNGAITTKKLKVTEDMTVALLNVHKIEAGEINFNSLFGDTGFIGSLRTTVLQADAITSTMIKADAVDATVLKSNAITAKHTITGAVIQTDAAADAGIRLDTTGLRAWNSNKLETLRITRSTGDLTIYNGNVQTTTNAARGIKLNAGGLSAYNSRGKLTFLIDAAEGDAQFDSRVMFGQKTNPSWVVVPWESTTQERAGIWLVNQASTGAENGIGGTNTAGMFMDNSNATFSNPMNVRGSNGGGVKIWGRLQSDDMYSGVIQNSNGLYKLQGANGSYFQSSVDFNGRIIYGGAPNTGSAANAHIAADGTIWKSSSASKFKADQRLLEVPDSILDIPMKDWIDKGKLEFAKELEAEPRPHVESVSKGLAAVAIEERVPGVIAEEVLEHGGKPYVTFDLQGEVEGVAYDRLAMARTAVLKRQLDELKARIDELEGKL